MQKLGVGIQLTTKRLMLLPEEVIMRRFIWLKGNRKGKLLEKHEIETLGMFLPGGGLNGKEDNYIWDWIGNFIMMNTRAIVGFKIWLEKIWN